MVRTRDSSFESVRAARFLAVLVISGYLSTPSTPFAALKATAFQLGGPISKATLTKPGHYVSDLRHIAGGTVRTHVELGGPRFVKASSSEPTSAAMSDAATLEKNDRDDVETETLDQGKSAMRLNEPTSQPVKDESTAEERRTSSDAAVVPSSYLPIIALCFFVAILSALDRVAMSVAILPLSTELHLTDSLKGEISSIFSLGYGLAIIPCGLIVAASSPRIVMAAGVALWSAATWGTPIMASLASVREILPTSDGAPIIYIAENVAPLLAIRAVMGSAESVVLPAIQRILAAWVPPENKSLAVAGIFSGFQFGTVTAYLLSPIVMENFGGWRGMFNLYGAAGVLWLIPWLVLARDAPPPPVGVAMAEPEECEARDVILVNSMLEDDASLVVAYEPVGCEPDNAAGSSSPSWSMPPEFDEALSVLRSAPWSSLLTSRGVWAMTLAHAANNWGLYNSLSWTPTFYAEQYGLNVRDSALLSILPSVAGAAGGLFAGAVADGIIQRVTTSSDRDGFLGFAAETKEETVTRIRKLFQGVALFGPALCLLTLAGSIPSEPAAAQALLTGTVGLQAFNAAGYGAATQEKAGEKWSGLLYSITSLPGVIFGSVGVYVTGLILDTSGQDWTWVFRLNAMVDILGAVAFIALYDSKREFE